jgi:hypothetical protein
VAISTRYFRLSKLISTSLQLFAIAAFAPHITYAVTDPKSVAELLKNECVAEDLELVKKLNSYAKDPNKSVGSQLTPSQIDQFTEASDRIGTMNMVRVVESNYQRDLVTIAKLLRIAKENYQFDKIPDRDSPDEFYYAMLVVWRNDIQRDIFAKEPYFTVCNLDYALSKNEIEPFREMIKHSHDYLISTQKGIDILHKNNLQTLDVDKLNSEDRIEILQIQKNEIFPMEKRKIYVNDLINIRNFAKISALIHESYSNDILISGGDINAVGSSIDKLIKNHTLTNEDIIMLKSWQAIDDKYPSKEVKDFKLIAANFNIK